MIDELDHVQLAAPAGCEPAARAFFSGLLGLRELVKPEALQGQGGCWFQVGQRGMQLHIGIESDFRPAAKAHPAFAVRDAEAVFQVLAAAGSECKWDESLPGVRRFFAKDPWGNRLEFTQPA